MPDNGFSLQYVTGLATALLIGAVIGSGPVVLTALIAGLSRYENAVSRTLVLPGLVIASWIVVFVVIWLVSWIGPAAIWIPADLNGSYSVVVMATRLFAIAVGVALVAGSYYGRHRVSA